MGLSRYVREATFDGKGGSVVTEGRQQAKESLEVVQGSVARLSLAASSSSHPLASALVK
jgi:hypothetical protein